MTFFLTSVFIFFVMWRPQEWLLRWLWGWPLLDIVVVGAIFSFMMENDTGRIRIPKRVPQIWLLGGLWFAAVMSHVAHTYFGGMMQTIPIVFKICFFTLLLICVMDRTERLRTILIILVGMSCFMALHAVLQHTRGYGFGGLTPMFDRRLAGTGNPYRSFFFGIFADPNDLSQMLASAIPLAFAIPRKLNFVTLLGSAGMAALLLVGALATQSRGGMVALAVMVAVMMLLVLPARYLPWCLGAVALAGLAASQFASGLLDESAHDRVIFWGKANYVFKQNPLFGIGHNMFWMVADDKAAHNAFVECYTELGLFGYTFWFGLLFLGFVGAWRTRRYLGGVRGSRERWLKRMSGLIVASAASFAASSYFLTRAFLYPLFFIFALMAAAPVAAREFLPEEMSARIMTKRDTRIVLPVMAVLSLIYIYLSIVFLNKAYYG